MRARLAALALVPLASGWLKAALENYGAKRHNFTAPSEGIDRDLAPGKKTTVTIRIPRSGRVLFYCRFHRQLGMAGRLAVK
jgi:plastocyanin